MANLIAATFEKIIGHIESRSVGDPNAPGKLLSEPDTFRTQNYSLMQGISQYIEERFVEMGLSGLFMASFQRLSQAAEKADRYRRLAQTAREVWLFGEADEMPFAGSPKIRFFDPEDPEFARFWLVLCDDPRFRLALFARERTRPVHRPLAFNGLGSHHKSGPLTPRNLEGFWTYRDEYIDLVRDSVTVQYAREEYEVTPNPALPD